MDWKPERAVQAKNRDFQKEKNQKNKKKTRLLNHVEGRTLCAGLQMATPSRPSINNELSPQEASVATLYQVLHRQWPDLFTIVPSPRKFVECLYCNVSPPPILPVLSRLVESIYHIQYIYNHTSYIHTFVHPCINTFICSYIHTFMRTKHIYIINLHMVALVTPKSWSASSFRFNSYLSCFKWSVLNKQTAWVSFVMFQVASPN